MIVDYIANRDEASFTEICTDLSIPKSSVHHLLEVLTVSQLL
ncbi:helix-turn-helix domain-containing protein [Symbiopectobacterium sp. RP]